MGAITMSLAYDGSLDVKIGSFAGFGGQKPFLLESSDKELSLTSWSGYDVNGALSMALGGEHPC